MALSEKQQQLATAFMEKRKYLVLGRNAAGVLQPTHSFSEAKPLKYVSSEDFLGVLVDEKYVVVDVDDKVAGQKLIAIVKHYGWLTNILETDRGYHFWFRSSEPLMDWNNVLVPLGFHVDIKSWGKNSQMKIKVGGNWRKWIEFNAKVDTIPKELIPFPNSENWPALLGKNEGSRNSSLFSLRVKLARLNWDDNKIHTLFLTINNFIFDEPLHEAEINSLFLTTVNSIGAPEDFFTGKGEFLPHIFGDLLIEKYSLIKYSNQIYRYENGFYVMQSKQDLSSLGKTLCEKLKINQLKEVINHIQVSPNCPQKTAASNYIALKNGIYNLDELEFEDFNKDIFVLNKLPITYNKNADSPEIKKFLSDIVQNNRELLAILIEFLGYCLTPNTKYQKALVLYGATASNGKSTFIKLLLEFFGVENRSTIAINQLSKRFNVANLLNKMVNFDNDVKTDYFEEPHVFKNLVTGDEVQAEFKGQDIFTLRSTTKMILATNRLPNTSDNTKGFFRRILIVPFSARFSASNNNLDESIITKITTEDNLSTLFNLALFGLKNLRKNGKFTNSESSEDLLENYMLTNNTVHAFLLKNELHPSDTVLSKDFINNKSCYNFYSEYESAIEKRRRKPVSLENFQHNVITFYELHNIGVEVKIIKEDNLYIEKFIAK